MLFAYSQIGEQEVLAAELLRAIEPEIVAAVAEFTELTYTGSAVLVPEWPAPDLVGVHGGVAVSLAPEIPTSLELPEHWLRRTEAEAEAEAETDTELKSIKFYVTVECIVQGSEDSITPMLLNDLAWAVRRAFNKLYPASIDEVEPTVSYRKGTMINIVPEGSATRPILHILTIS